MAKKKSFVLYFDCKKQIDMLSDEQAGKLFKALFDFAEYDEMPEFSDGMLTMAFSFISAQIERDSVKYEARCEKNRQIALEREKRKRERFNTNVNECKQTNTNNTDNDTDTDNDNDNENDTDTDNDTDNDMQSDKPTAKPSRTPPKKKYGEYGHVKLTDDEFQRLCGDYSEKIILDYIRKIDEYLQMTGKKSYKDYNLTIRNWLNRDNVKKGSDGFNVEDYTALINNFD